MIGLAKRAICFHLAMVLLAPFLFCALQSIIACYSVILGLFGKYSGLQYFGFAAIGPLIAILLAWVEKSLFDIAIRKVRTVEVCINLSLFMAFCGSISALFYGTRW